MIEIIHRHLACYPKMQVQDAAKLIYQNEFGGGHMIANPELSLKRIQEEYHPLSLTIQNQTPIVESIGNGMSRIYLSALSNGLRAEILNEMFVQSANNKKGTIEGLEKKLDLLLNECKNGNLPFQTDKISKFINDWKEKGYPAISHSSIYRDAYQPAYRVIEDSYVQIYKVIQEIEQEKKKFTRRFPFVVAIDGMSGSGKTTLGELLHTNYPESNLFHMDDYFLQPHQRTEKRLNEVGGNVDYERFKTEVLRHLTDKNGLAYQKYDCCTQTLGSQIHVPWRPLIIIEGSYSHHPHFKNVYDLRIFCEIEKEQQKKRILARNGAHMLERFITEWIPKENCYFETYHIKETSEIIL